MPVNESSSSLAASWTAILLIPWRLYREVRALVPALVVVSLFYVSGMCYLEQTYLANVDAVPYAFTWPGMAITVVILLFSPIIIGYMYLLTLLLVAFFIIVIPSYVARIFSSHNDDRDSRTPLT